MFTLKISHLPVLITSLLITSMAFANTDPSSDIKGQHILQNQDERNQVLLNQIIPKPKADITQDMTEQGKVETTPPTHNSNIPCFRIQQIHMDILNTKTHQMASFDFALKPEIKGTSAILGSCMNINDIQALTHRIQNRLINKGFITTRVVIGEQNISQGKLSLMIIPGLIGNIHINTDNSPIHVYHRVAPNHANNQEFLTQPALLSNALVLKPNQLLNIRPLETTLENLKRVPSTDVHVNITPSSNHLPGFSDIIIDYKQKQRIRANLYFDDAGEESTGQYQSTATVSIDNPFNYNDLLYFSIGRDLGNQINSNSIYPGSKGNRNYMFGLVVPIKNTLINLNANRYNYHQTVVGSTQDYLYRGTATNINAKTTYLIHRNQNSKIQLGFGGFIKSQDSYIDDTKVDVQSRKISGLETNFNWQNQIRFRKSQHHIDIDVGYKRGINAFGAITPPEELFDEGTNKTGIYHIDFNVNSQYLIHQDTPINHTLQLKTQFAQKPLIPSERMAIGGRYTVRGFDGGRSLSADHGILLRQDVNIYPNWLNPTTNRYKHSHSIYFGLDAGYVKNKNSEQDDLLAGHHLIGSALGVKGQITPNQTDTPLNFYYDLFVAKAISQPKYFLQQDWVGGMSFGVGF